MITEVVVSCFKSLSYEKFKFSKFNCLIGINGAGKSTTLQAIDFISQLMRGRVEEWLKERDWLMSELNKSNSSMFVSVAYQSSNADKIAWMGLIKKHSLQCSIEKLAVNGNILFDVEKGHYSIGEKSVKKPITFNYQGSILSQLRDSEIPAPILEFRNYLRQIRSLELLSPDLLRKRARSTDTDIGTGGEKLSAFLHSIKGENRDALIALLKTFYANLIDYKVSSQRSGWKKLVVIEQFGEKKLETEARHINDGLLRILAILAQASSDHSLILLDEIENGINPEIVEKLVDALVNSKQQILVTTHSPMILNYLEDDVARNSVQFVYKNDNGGTKIRPFFSIPRIGEKLNYMGAGEAFVDTDLIALTQECVALDMKELEEKEQSK
jgi:predicted ATPase